MPPSPTVPPLEWPGAHPPLLEGLPHHMYRSDLESGCTCLIPLEPSNQTEHLSPQRDSRRHARQHMLASCKLSTALAALPSHTQSWPCSTKGLSDPWHGGLARFNLASFAAHA